MFAKKPNNPHIANKSEDSYSYSKCLQTETVSVREYFTAVGLLHREFFFFFCQSQNLAHKSSLGESHPSFLDYEGDKEKCCHFKFSRKRTLLCKQLFFSPLRWVKITFRAVDGVHTG